MATGVKIALIGAGSATFAAGIVRDLCVTDGLSGSHVTLMDVDAGRLATTHRLAVRLAGELGAEITFSTTESREEALTGADGLDPWEPGTLLAWASAQPRPVELMARFVVSLEDPEDAAFPIHEALQSWDALGRLAFSTWAMRAWWVP